MYNMIGRLEKKTIDSRRRMGIKDIVFKLLFFHIILLVEVYI